MSIRNLVKNTISCQWKAFCVQSIWFDSFLVSKDPEDGVSMALNSCREGLGKSFNNRPSIQFLR